MKAWKCLLLSASILSIVACNDKKGGANVCSDAFWIQDNMLSNYCEAEDMFIANNDPDTCLTLAQNTLNKYAQSFSCLLPSKIVGTMSGDDIVVNYNTEDIQKIIDEAKANGGIDLGEEFIAEKYAESSQEFNALIEARASAQPCDSDLVNAYNTMLEACDVTSSTSAPSQVCMDVWEILDAHEDSDAPRCLMPDGALF